MGSDLIEKSDYIQKLLLQLHRTDVTENVSVLHKKYTAAQNNYIIYSI